MPKLTDYRIIENQEPMYSTDGKRCIEVVTEDPIKGVNHYLIDDNNNIIAGPAKVDGTSLSDKAHEFYIKKEGVILSVGVVLVVAGATYIMVRNPAATMAFGNILIRATAQIGNILTKIKPDFGKLFIQNSGKEIIIDSVKKEWIASYLIGANVYNSLFQEAQSIPAVYRDPLLIDLNGDGIKTTTIENGTYFDHDNNGYAEKLAA